MNFIKPFVIRVNDLIRKSIFRQRGLIYMLFGVEVVASPQVQRYCEWGTIALRFIVTRYIRPGYRILDVGTGAHALLAIFVKKHFPSVSVLGSDIVPERISFAKTTAIKNNVELKFVVSDMFDRITGCFDLILFNPPLTPSDILTSRP